MRKRARIARSPALLGLVLVAWGCGGPGNPAATDSAAGGDSALVVRAEKVASREWVVSVPVSGNLRSQSQVEVRAEVGGRLLAAHAEEGDAVSKGQLLAELDPVNYRLAHEEASASLEVAGAGLAQAEVTVEHARREKIRADNLLRTGGITEKDHVAAETGVKEAEAQLRMAEAKSRQARAALSIAEKALEDCRVPAPAGGRVQKKFYDQGSLLTAGSPLYVLVDNARLELECPVPSYRLAEIRSGQHAEFTTPTWGDRRFSGAVHSINPMVAADNRSISVIVRISNPRGELRSGMYAQGEIQVARQPAALVISRSALITEAQESGSGSVYVVEGGKASRRQVVLGGLQRDRVWIREGLREGQLVVSEIGPALQDGTAVQLQTSTPAREP